MLIKAYFDRGCGVGPSESVALLHAQNAHAPRRQYETTFKLTEGRTYREVEENQQQIPYLAVCSDELTT
jgi:hypothetical protein